MNRGGGRGITPTSRLTHWFSSKKNATPRRHPLPYKVSRQAASSSQVLRFEWRAGAVRAPALGLAASPRGGRVGRRGGQVARVEHYQHAGAGLGVSGYLPGQALGAEGAQRLIEVLDERGGGPGP